MRLALHQPDIPQNTGSLIRLAACLGVPLDIIEPCGFPLDDRSLRRVGMDYVRTARLVRHIDYGAFAAQAGRVILLSARAASPYIDFAFAPEDTLLLGRESAGVPETVHASVDAAVRVPIRSETRSLNVAIAAAMVLGEALRQTQGFPAQHDTGGSEDDER